MCVKFSDPCLNHSGEIRPKDAGCGIFGLYSNFDKCRLEIAGDVIPGVALEHVGMDVRAKFDDSRLNNGRTIRLFGRLDPFLLLDEAITSRAVFVIISGLNWQIDRWADRQKRFGVSQITLKWYEIDHMCQ